ncbi:MAG: hypothetical protein ACKVU4_10855 [Phycisphaerales bacterium]
MNRGRAIAAGAIGVATLVVAPMCPAEMIGRGPSQSPGAPIRPGPQIPGFGDGGFSAVWDGDSASLALKVYANPQLSVYLNSQGDSSVVRGGGFKNTGSAALGFGSYTVQATWDEFITPTNNTIQIIWKTSNAQRFIPAGATIQGQPVGFVEARVGVTDAISFWPWITTVNMVSATIASSTNGGLTLSTFDITGSVSNPWNGTSFGSTLPASSFNNANYIMATFTYVPVPAPASVGGVLLFAGLCAARRRRSV